MSKPHTALNAGSGPEPAPELGAETVELCAKVAERCMVKFSICKSGILQDQIDIARKDIAAAIRSLIVKTSCATDAKSLSKIKSEGR